MKTMFMCDDRSMFALDDIMQIRPDPSGEFSKGFNSYHYDYMYVVILGTQNSVSSNGTKCYHPITFNDYNRLIKIMEERGVIA